MRNFIDIWFNFLNNEETPKPKPVYDPNAQAKRYDRVRDLNAIRTELFNETGVEPTVHEIWERDSARRTH